MTSRKANNLTRRLFGEGLGNRVMRASSSKKSACRSAVKANSLIDSSHSVKSDSTGCTDTCTECSFYVSITSSLSPSERTSSGLPIWKGRETQSAIKRVTSSTRRCDSRIHFNDHVEIILVLGRHDYTDEELNACWLQGDEYQDITNSCCKQIQKMETSHRSRGLYGSSSRIRGLESHMKLAALSKAKNRRSAWDVVLHEQEEQSMLGVIDDEPIAQRYGEVASSCQLWAIRMALKDQREAEAVYDGME